MFKLKKMNLITFVFLIITLIFSNFPQVQAMETLKVSNKDLFKHFKLSQSGRKIPLTMNPNTNSLLFTTLTDFNSRQVASFKDLGLEKMTIDRDFRSALVTKLNSNSSRYDLISNTFGRGCLQIFSFHRNNASINQQLIPVFFDNKGHEIQCVGGYGETMVSADVNNDGLLDLLLPYYQKSYLFKNNGNSVVSG